MTKTIDTKAVASILTALGFEVDDDAAFVKDVARFVEANDRDGLIVRIAVVTIRGRADGVWTGEAVEIKAVTPRD